MPWTEPGVLMQPRWCRVVARLTASGSGNEIYTGQSTCKTTRIPSELWHGRVSRPRQDAVAGCALETGCCDAACGNRVGMTASIVVDRTSSIRQYGPEVKAERRTHRGNRIWSYAPSSPRAAGAKESETAGLGRTERPRDEGFERFRNTRVPNAFALQNASVPSHLELCALVREGGRPNTGRDSQARLRRRRTGRSLE